MRIDHDAVLWSASPADRQDRPLLVLLHGFNSHEGDLFGLSPYLPLQPVIASLRAPLAASAGHAWFPFMADGMDAALQAADASTTAVLDWLDTVAPAAGDRAGAADGPGADAAAAPSVGLLGFSQGGAMAIELLRRAPGRFAFAASLAGFVLPGDRAGDDELAAVRPPAFWGRGTDDHVIPAEAITRTQTWLPEHTALDARIYEGLGHSVSERELGDLTAWLAARYA